jgi:hypothetical protein
MRAVYTPGLAELCWDAYDDEFSLKQDAIPEYQRQGQFDVCTEPSGQRRFWFVCPGKCKALTAIALRPVADGSPQSWDFNDNLQSPTLRPSINHPGCWHGWLTDGVFSEC